MTNRTGTTRVDAVRAAATTAQVSRQATGDSSGGRPGPRQGRQGRPGDQGRGGAKRAARDRLAEQRATSSALTAGAGIRGSPSPLSWCSWRSASSVTRGGPRTTTAPTMPPCLRSFRSRVAVWWSETARSMSPCGKTSNARFASHLSKPTATCSRQRVDDGDITLTIHPLSFLDTSSAMTRRRRQQMPLAASLMPVRSRLSTTT